MSMEFRFSNDEVNTSKIIIQHSLFDIQRINFIKHNSMEIKVLGTGCAKCKTLEKSTREAVAELGIDANIEKVEDIVKIMSYGIMHTPALVINGKVVLSGRLANVNEIKDLIKKQ